jgi:hypothetical protein
MNYDKEQKHAKANLNGLQRKRKNVNHGVLLFGHQVRFVLGRQVLPHISNRNQNDDEGQDTNHLQGKLHGPQVLLHISSLLPNGKDKEEVSQQL